ncbi:D-galactarate permease [Escherichia coli]|uniref:D-galactarate permease n=1 Tax=Escherichia coli TaxID=562 RepID=A0A376RC67_ECOLX|nr:D-galactarate permease [Escherichia coli]
MILDTVDVKKKGVHTRYLILLIIFIVTAVNYADRATLSIAGTEVAKELQLSAVSMGYIFSAFGWAYLLMQIPGGWLLDKFGSKKVYTYSLFFWSLFTFLQGFVDMFPLAWAGSPCSLCALCWGSRKRHHSRRKKRPYCRRLVPDERTWYCLRHL